MSKETRAERPSLSVVARLIEVAGLDTVYRDLYLMRARAVLARCLPDEEYVRLKAARVQIDQWLRQSRAAVAHGDWVRVRELATSVAEQQRWLDEWRPELDVADVIYGPHQVPIDAFSPGFERVSNATGGDLRALRDRIVHTLTGLQHDDSDWAAFYEQRRSHFAGLALHAETPGAAAEMLDPIAVQREAMQAAERGEATRLLSLAQAMLEPRRAATLSLLSTGEIPRTLPMKAPVAFRAETVMRARRLGLAAATLKPYGRISAFVSRHAWHSSFPEEHVMRNGASAATPAAVDLQLRPGVPPAMRELLALFVIHPYVNSAGARYLPFLATEHVLVEDFEEATDLTGSAPLLEALGLPRRRALSRLEIESALLQRGSTIVERELGVDAREFRLVCIPFDVYARAGLERRWGRHPLWTHFDGYQLLRDGSMLALVGGDIRYGGLYDLCSISRTDQREGVIVRFAVVRRDRLLTSSQ